MQPTQPELWERIKAAARQTSEGSEPGQWSARKAVLSQLEYRRRGGRWRRSEIPQPR